MRLTLDALFEGGVFKPAQRPDLSDGEHVRITVESLPKRTPQEILKLAAQVYDGLSPRDTDEIEEMVRRGRSVSDNRR